MFNQKEQDRILIFCAAEMARRRKSKGLKLNYPEAVALITDEAMEKAREGSSYEKAVEHSKKILSKAEVLDGVAELVDSIKLEAQFDDGTKLMIIKNPICD